MPGKLSKAEKDKLKKEEELQRQKEEEEARLAAEAEERERQERERIESEEKQRLLNEERSRRQGQIEELESVWDYNRTTLYNEQSEARKNAKWARYMRCDGSPDPTIQGEINTHMNLWRENNQHNDIDSVLKESDLVLALLGELDHILETTPSEEITEKETILYRQTMFELETLLQEKLDAASHDLLRHASEYADTETSNLQRIVTNDVITLCMWGNLSKNPRIRSFEFEEKGFLFDIPRLLALSDCAYRVLFTKYDHFSPQCPTYKPRRKLKTETTIVEENAGEEGTEKAEGEEGEDGEKKEGEEEGEKTEEATGGEVQRETTEELMATLRDDGKKKKVPTATLR